MPSPVYIIVESCNVVFTVYKQCLQHNAHYPKSYKQSDIMSVFFFIIIFCTTPRLHRRVHGNVDFDVVVRFHHHRHRRP